MRNVMRDKRLSDLVDKITNASKDILNAADKREKDPPEIPSTVLFVEKMVSSVIMEALTKNLSKDNKAVTQDEYEKTKREYARLKMAVQEAVAKGFTDAMEKFTEKDVEFYCLVKTVPAPPSKEYM